MEPLYYLDLCAKPSESSVSRTPRPHLVAWVEKAMDALHGVLSDRPGRYAVALPEYQAGESKRLGRTVRVFATSPEDLAFLRSDLEARDDGWMAAQVRLSPIAQVPVDHEGPWVSYSRVRAPRRGKMQPATFIQRLNHIKSLPSFVVFSRSTGQTFPMAIERTQWPTASGASGCAGCPDAYGWGRPGAPVLLPELD